LRLSSTISLLSNRTLIISAIFTLAFASAAHSEFTQNNPEAKPFVLPDRLEVRFADDVTLGSTTHSFGRVRLGAPAVDAVLGQYDALQLRPMFPWRDENSTSLADRNMSRFQTLTVPENTNLDELISDLLATGKVQSAEKVWAMPIAEVTPDDPQWNLQYAPEIIGANAVWDVEPGSDTAKIALLDTGVNYRHEDLVNKVWVNPGEDIDGDGEVYDLDDLNGFDDDGNGLIDDLIGYDFFGGFGGGLGIAPGEDPHTPDSDPNDFHGHGTHCAGIAAAATGNALGVAGIAGGDNPATQYYNRGPRILCLRIGAKANDNNGYVTMGAAASAIDYAAKHGADVISCSWGSSVTTALFNAINLALGSGIVIVKAAGNANNDESDYMNDYPRIISVASTNSSDTRSGFSSFGSWVEISAPGSSIRSTNSVAYTPNYSYKSGTSMATPAYAGAALLVKSLMPSWTAQEIDSVLLNSADTIDYLNPGFEEQLGSGRVNVQRAIENLPVANFSAGPELIGQPGLEVDFTDLSPNSPSAWSWTFGDGAISSNQHPSHIYNSVGVFDVTLEATEPNGIGFEQHKRQVVIHSDTVGGDTGSGLLGSDVVVPINLKNDFPVKSIIIPLNFSDANGVSITLDTFSTAGLRTEYFEVKTALFYDAPTRQLVVKLTSDTTEGFSNYLEPGDGPVLNLHCKFSGTSANAVLPVTTEQIGIYPFSVETIYGTYTPESLNAFAYMSGCCDTPGDADNNASVTIADVTYLIARIFSGGPAPVCQDEGDADGNSSITIADVTYLIARIFSGGGAPICGSTGS
jgi:subtilisin family serine protease